MWHAVTRPAGAQVKCRNVMHCIGLYKQGNWCCGSVQLRIACSCPGDGDGSLILLLKLALELALALSLSRNKIKFYSAASDA